VPTQFTYVPVGSLGALQVQQESGPFANSAITSAYDALGRLSQRTVQGAGAETFQYDALGRLSNHGLQVTAPVTDFVYGGMFYNADSGLYLAKYRIYDPAFGRRLSRDPLGEPTDLLANLCGYVGGNPTNLKDPEGLQVVAKTTNSSPATASRYPRNT
jgi:RHS repeat-associated protein